MRVIVMPAKAGIQVVTRSWIPAFAGMTIGLLAAGVLHAEPISDQINTVRDEAVAKFRGEIVKSYDAEFRQLFEEDARIRHEAVDELRRHADTERALLILAELYIEEAERASVDSPDYSHAIQVLERIVHEFPDSASKDKVYYLLGVCYAGADRSHDALAIWNKLVAEFPYSDLRDEVLFRVGDEYFADRKWDDAAAAYQQLTDIRAVYKLAWVDYLRSRYDEAIKGFSAVLDRDSASNLVPESQQYLALSFLERNSDDVVDAFTVHFSQNGHKPYERAVAIELAEALSKMARYEEADRMINYAIGLEPDSPGNVELAARAIQFIADTGSTESAMKAREVFVAQYKTGTLVRDQLRILMTYEHGLARAEKSEARYQKTAQLYAQYISTFPAEDDVAKIIYLLGEAAFQGGWYADAAQAFQQVDATLDLVFARRALIEQSLDLSSIKPEKKGSLTAPIPIAFLEYIDAVDALRERIPGAPENSAFLFETAGIYYAYGDWAQAEKRFHDIIALYPTLEVAKLSADLLLIDRIAQNDWKAVAADAARFRRAQIGGVTKEFETVEMSARFKEAQALFAMAEQTMASGEVELARSQYKLAAEQYLSLQHDDPQSEFGDKMLYNAAIALDLAQQHAEAQMQFDRLMRDYPKSPLAEKALLTRATRFEERLELEKAAQSYARFAQLYPHSENASSALTNSGILYEALQQYLIAARIFEKLGTADGILRASRLYQKAHMPADHMRLFKQYMARFPDSPESAYYTLKAQYNSLEAERHQFDAMTIQSKVGRVQGQQLKAKTAKLLELKKKYEAVVVKYGLSEWTVASVYQIGALYENLFRAMLAAPCPADVEKIDESACDEYQSLLEDKAMVLEGKAIDAFKLTLEKSALTPDATEWSFAAQDALHNLRPNDFPMSVRPLTQPIDVALGQAELKALQQSARARLEVNAKDMTARLDMAKAFYSDTKYEAAKMVLEDSLAMDANQPLMNEWLGYTLREEHDTVPAIAALEKSLAADDKLAIAKDSLALLLLTRGDLDRALMLLIEVTPALPESAILQLQVGNAYLLLGRYIEAIARYNEAIQLKSDLLDAYYNLGLANMIAEKFEAAKENLVHYIEHSRDEASKKNAQAYLVTVNRKIQIEAQRRAREKEAVHEEVVSPDAAPSE